MLNDLLAIFAKGKESITKFFRELVDIITEWFLRNKRLFENFSQKLSKLFGDLDAEDLDFMQRKHKIGNLGGKILTTRQIRALRKLLKNKYNVDLIYENSSNINKLFKPVGSFKKPSELFEYMFRNDKAGASIPETGQMILPSNTTEIVVFHELVHVKQWNAIGKEAYSNLSKLEKEMHVWEQIIKNRKSWTIEELLDSLKYINREREKLGLEKLNIEL